MLSVFIFYFLALVISPTLVVNTNFPNEIPLPTQTSSLFSGSGNCALCHISNGTVLTENGVDISPPTHWRSSMMGNASKDPLWRAVVEHEVHELPELQIGIESTCTRCHSPMGWRQAVQNGDSTYSIAQMKQNPLANDGVSCTVCHQINNSNFGNPSSYSGGYIITSERIIYGPYQNPLTGPMITFVNYNTMYSAHVGKSELCATCHTLFTPTVNYSGQIVGKFPEQTPYIEWKNSNYPQNNIQCQTCHMPVTNIPVDISTIPAFDTTKRTPYWKHLFMGANEFVGKILRNNVDSLQLSASLSNFDTTLSYVDNILKNSSVLLSSNALYSAGFLTVNLKIENLSGHKIPTGIPLRRMWVHFILKDGNNNVVFESGGWNAGGEITGQNATYEEHYSVITGQDQVQIYEGVLQDVNNNVTYDLMRAASYKKDNRIPPKGFVNTHASYDTVAIIGSAVSDTNFNRQGAIQGTGSDIITYIIPASAGSNYTISFEICYQSVSPRLVNRISTAGTPDVVKFMSLYNPADKSPTIMKSISYGFTTGIKKLNNEIPGSYALSQNYPNPFNPTTKICFDISSSVFSSNVSGGNPKVTLVIFDMLGKELATLVNEYLSPGKYSVEWDASQFSSGTYIYKLYTQGYSDVKKMLLIK